MKQKHYPMRPPAEKIYHEPRREPPQTKEHETLGKMGLSEMLTALVAMTLSDGMATRSLWSLLKDILPYTEAGDRRQITRMLGLRNAARQYDRPEARLPHRALTSTERLLGLLNTLKKYSAKGTRDQFTMMERFIRMQQKMEQSGGDMMPLMMELMGADMGSVMQMMNMFGKGI